jgi:hypothetical protein
MPFDEGLSRKAMRGTVHMFWDKARTVAELEANLNFSGSQLTTNLPINSYNSASTFRTPRTFFREWRSLGANKPSNSAQSRMSQSNSLALMDSIRNCVS